MKMFLFFLAWSVLIGACGARAEDAPKRKVLFLTQSAGFVHDVVNRKKAFRYEGGREVWSNLDAPAPLSYAEEVLTELGKTSGRFEAVCSQNSADIHAENLKQFDCVVFYTSGNLPFSSEQKTALLDFVRGGKGFVGTHSASDTCYNWAEYGRLVGGYFDGHPWHERVVLRVENANHPATRHLGDTWRIVDEIYQFRNWSRERVDVLLSLDPSNSKIEKRKIRQPDGSEVEQEGEAFFSRGKRKDNDYAIAWTRSWGDGRAFYTALGHRGDVWRHKKFQEHLLGGILWAMGAEK